MEVETQDGNLFGRIKSGTLTLYTRARLAWYMGDMRNREKSPVRYRRTHIITSAEESYIYALYEPSKDSDTEFIPLASCWFDEDPGKNPKLSQTLVGLVEIGHWAPLVSTCQIKRDDGGRRDLHIRKDPAARFRVWALVAKWCDLDSDDFDADNLIRVGVACMESETAFENFPMKTVKIF